jgi:hypothetical protein
VGVVTAIMPGIAHITATYQGVSGVADITILAPATPLFFTVRGTVTNAITGAPIGNVNIFLGTPAGNKNATTDNNGNWSIGGIPNGFAGITSARVYRRGVSQNARFDRLQAIAISQRRSDPAA